MKKYIVFALIALFAAVLFIACDNNVKVDNSVAFTQRIASEGAFVVNGKSYDSLQAAINAATGAKMSAPDPVKITLTKDYAGRSVSIPEDAQVAIDLNGHTLTFVDIKDTAALTVGEDALFVMSNGTVTILDKTADLTLIDADDAHVVFSDVYANLSDDQNAVFITGSADGKAVFAASADSIVFGAVTAIGEHAAGDLIEYSDVALIVLNALSDVRMTNTYIDVSSTGHVTLNALAGENRFRATKGSSSITNNTDEPIVIFGGLYSIARSGVSSYYGSLQEALDSLDEDNLEIVLRDNDDSTNPVVASNGKSFTIVLSGNYEPGYGIHATSITADADMAIVNPGYSNSVIYPEIYGDIDVAGKFVVTGYYDYGRIHIDGTVTAANMDANHVTFSKAVTASEVIAYYAEFGDDIFATTAANLTYSYVGNGEGDGVFAPEIAISRSTLNVNYLQGTEAGAPATSVSVTESTGTIGTIVASNSTATTPVITLSTPEVNNTAQLTVGAVNASSNNVSITGYSEDFVIVNGAVTAGEVIASYAVFGDDIFATTAANLTYSNVGNEEGVGVFAPVIAISRSTLNVNYLQGTEAGAPATSVSVTESTGTIGTIVASDSTATTPVITLSTPHVNNTAQLTVGAVNASSNSVSITGYFEDSVIVNGAVTAGVVTADYAVFGDDIFATTAATLTNSNVGNGDGVGVFAPVIAISGSTLNVNYLQGTEAGAPATSVSVTESTGTIGTIVASNSTATTPVITLSTPASTTEAKTLSVGVLEAAKSTISIVGNVQGGPVNNRVTVTGTVNCATLDAEYAEFDATITASTSVDIDNSTVGDSTVTDNVYSPVIIISNSTLHVANLKGSSTTAAKSVSVTGSIGTIDTIVASDSTAVATVITLSTPNTGDGVMSVNTLNAGSDNISITGHATATNLVSVSGDVTCSTLNATYASFSGVIKASVIDGGYYYGDFSVVAEKETNFTGGYFYGKVTLSGSETINISSENCCFDHSNGLNATSVIFEGTGTLNVTGGLFASKIVLMSGSGLFEGTWSEGVYGQIPSVDVHNLYILGGDWVIKSAKLCANNINQLNSIGTHIYQNSASDYVEIYYAADFEGGAATVCSSTPIENIKLDFVGPNYYSSSDDYTSLFTSTTLTLGAGVQVDGHIFTENTSSTENNPVLVSVNKSISGVVYNNTSWGDNYAPEKAVGSEYWYRHNAW